MNRIKEALRSTGGLSKLVVLSLAATVLMASPSSAATTEETAILNGLIVAGAQTGNETPSDHSRHYNDSNGIQWDIYGSPGASVYPAFYSRTTNSPTGVRLSVADRGPTCGSAGRTAEVTIRVDGVRVAIVTFGHLENINTNAKFAWQSIGNLPRSNYTFQEGCWEVRNSAGIHTHLSLGKACFVKHDVVEPLSGRDVLGVFNSAYSRSNNSSCSSAEIGEANTAVCVRRQPSIWGTRGEVTRGTVGDDVIVGTAGADTIYGYSGNDRICSFGGNDYAHGGSGSDRMWMGRGNDHAVGGSGNDFLLGGRGDDLLAGSVGKDRCVQAGSGGHTASCEE